MARKIYLSISSSDSKIRKEASLSFGKTLKNNIFLFTFIMNNISFASSDRFVILDRGEVVHELNKEDISTPEELMKIMRETIIKH